MKVYTPEISWHERDPIYTCHFHPTIKNKLATSGVTGIIRVSTVTSNYQVFFLINLLSPAMGDPRETRPNNNGK